MGVWYMYWDYLSAYNEPQDHHSVCIPANTDGPQCLVLNNTIPGLLGGQTVNHFLHVPTVYPEIIVSLQFPRPVGLEVISAILNRCMILTRPPTNEAVQSRLSQETLNCCSCNMDLQRWKWRPYKVNGLFLMPSHCHQHRKNCLWIRDWEATVNISVNTVCSPIWVRGDPPPPPPPPHTHTHTLSAYAEGLTTLYGVRPSVFGGLDSGLDSGLDCGTGLTESCARHFWNKKLRNGTI